MKVSLLNCLALSLVICSLTSCNQQSNKSLANKSTVKTVKASSITIKDTLKTVVKMPAVENFSLEDFPKKWIELNEVNGEQIIEIPCDATNGSFTFRKIKGHGYMMNCGGGQDDLDYQLVSYNSRPDTLELVGKNMLSKKDIVFTITKMDTITHTAHWEWTDMDWGGKKESMDMVTSKGKPKFRIVKDPPCL